jgi:ATP-dependent helicase/nuclease subunit A
MEGERLRAVTDFSRDIALDASAGTGKTATLVARVTNLFLAKRELATDRVLLLTFTEKAAAEMRSRIVSGWEMLLSCCRAAVTPEEAQERIRAVSALVRVPQGAYGTLADLTLRAEEMADGVGRLSVTTFHSFCRRLLLSFPAEAGVDPRFEVLSEAAAADAWDAAFRGFLRAEFRRPEADPTWERVLAGSPDPEAVFGMIRRLVLFHRDLLLAGPPDFGTSADLLAHLRREYGAPVSWFRTFAGGIVDRDHEMAPVFEEALRALSAGWEAVCRDDLEAAAALAPAGLKAFGFRADRARSPKGFPRPPGLTLAGARDALQAFWRDLAEAPRGDAAARFLVGRSLEAARAYEEAKGGGMDFLDLLLRANALLCGNREVAERVSERFLHIFVDEFQDTDPLQAEMLEALSRCGGPPGRLFLVGDPKQSIYGFRRADIQVYRRFRRDLVGRGGQAIDLVRNFRSRPDLIASVNGLFGRVLGGEEDFSPSCPPVVPAREDAGEGAPVTLFSLAEGVPEPEFLCALIRAAAGRVAVGGKPGEPGRTASYRDIAVLYRSDAGGEALASYRDALERAGIPFVVPSRKGFFARQEVQDLRMALAAVDAPADSSARYAALKTIFFGLADEEILPAFGAGGGEASPRVRDALALLERLSARRGRGSLPGLLSELYRETGVDFVAARLPEGERILQNLAKAHALASAFEWGGRGSLKAFLAEIRRRTEEEAPESEFPSFEEGEDAVRISTIHLSKGLEFPVVILANLSRGGKRRPEGLRVDRVRGLGAVLFPGFRTFSAFRQVPLGEGTVPFEQWEARKQDAEEKRLLYVAATRARDRLYLVEGGRGRGSALREALHAGLSGARAGGAATCVVTRLPGERVLFPAEDGPEGSGGELLRVEVERLPTAERAAAPAAPEPPLEAGRVPPPPGPPPPAPPPITLRELHDRAAGRRFGERVHRALEAAPPVVSPWPPELPVPVPWGEGEEERWRAIRRKIVSCGFYRDLCRAVLVGTEIPLLACRGGWSGEERADLVVRFPAGPSGAAPGGHWVVDYKTGRREPEAEEAYVRQVRRYVEILAGAWSVTARGFIWYLETGEAIEVEDR